MHSDNYQKYGELNELYEQTGLEDTLNIAK